MEFPYNYAKWIVAKTFGEGIEKEDLFDFFYLVVESKSLQAHTKSSSLDLIEISEEDSCYDRTYIVWAHPLIVYMTFWKKVLPSDQYRFFRIEKGNIDCFEEIDFCYPEFKGKKYSFFIKDELGENSPEFDKKLLKKIFKTNLRSSFDVIKRAVLNFFDEKEIIEMLKKDLISSFPYSLGISRMRCLALEKIHNHQKFLTDIALNNLEGEWTIKASAIANITDTGVLLNVFKQATSYVVQEQAFESIMRETKDGLLAQNFLAKTAINRRVFKDIREKAIKKIVDIELLKEIFWYLKRGFVDFSYDDYPSLKDSALFMINFRSKQKNIDEQGFFIEVALSEDLPEDARCSAIYYINDEKVLKAITLEEDVRYTISQALRKKIEKISTISSS